MLCALAFFAYHGYESTALFQELLVGVKWQWLVFVLLILMLQSVVGGLFTYTLVAPFSDSMKLSEVLGVHISRLPARYLPGGIWHVASKLYDFHDRGVALSGVAKIGLFETLVPIVVTFLFGGIVVSSFERVTGLWNSFALLCAGASMLSIFAYSWLGLFSPIAKFLIPKRSYYQALAVVSIYWVLAGLGFCFYLASLFEQLRGLVIFEIWGVYLLSWGIGNVAFFSPQGVGVLEWAASSMLPMVTSLGSMMVVVAGYRVLILISDVLCYLIYSLVQIKKPKCK